MKSNWGAPLRCVDAAAARSARVDGSDKPSRHRWDQADGEEVPGTQWRTGQKMDKMNKVFFILLI